jgi:alpha-tubulin suppressor-like RCC1 family protein
MVRDASSPQPNIMQGYNAYSQLGDGTATARNSPAQVGSSANWAVVAASTSRTCGINAGGDLFCWGYNNAGQLGDASIATRSVPTLVASTLTWSSLAMSALATCGVPGAAPGSIRLVSAPPAPPRPPPAAVSGGNCWGANTKGQWGDGTAAGSKFAPAAIAPPWAQISLSENSACGINSSSALHCWGTDSAGSLGDGTGTTRYSPTPVAGGGQWIAVFAASAHVSGRAAAFA